MTVMFPSRKRMVDWLFSDPRTQARYKMEALPLLRSASDFLAHESRLHDLAEAGSGEYLWIWELSGPAIVMGHAADCIRDVHQQACADAGVPILRRNSGGRSVLLNHGCVNYTLILRHQGRGLREWYRSILSAVLDAVGIAGARCEETDLIFQDRKFSGCAQRRSRNTLLHHGTILYDFDISAVERFLAVPPRQPAYRRGRSHRDFLTNVRVHPEFSQRLADRFPQAVAIS
jgi:lipoate-protein ligase A